MTGVLRVVHQAGENREKGLKNQVKKVFKEGRGGPLGNMLGIGQVSRHGEVTIKGDVVGVRDKRGYRELE